MIAPPCGSARGSINLTAGSAYELRDLHASLRFISSEPANKRQEAQFIESKILTRYLQLG